MNIIGTYSEFLIQMGYDSDIFDKEKEIIISLLKLDVKDIVLTCSDEDYEFCDNVSSNIHKEEFIEDKHGYKLYNVKFNNITIPLVYNYSEGCVGIFFYKEHIPYLDTLFTK